MPAPGEADAVGETDDLIVLGLGNQLMGDDAIGVIVTRRLKRWPISGARVVVSTAQNVSPDTYPQVFTPAAPARYVLELPAGYVKAYTVEVGDEVRF